MWWQRVTANKFNFWSRFASEPQTDPLAQLALRVAWQRARERARQRRVQWRPACTFGVLGLGCTRQSKSLEERGRSERGGLSRSGSHRQRRRRWWQNQSAHQEKTSSALATAEEQAPTVTTAAHPVATETMAILDLNKR